MALGLFSLALAAAAQPRDTGPLPPSPPEAVHEMYRIGSCVAERQLEAASAMLAMDFTSRVYRNEMDRLLDRNRNCFERGSRMRFNRMLFAGAVAEHLVERDSDPLNLRLARAALQPATPARTPSDRIAICVVRSVPDDVARLFETEVTSQAETSAARALGPALSLCSETGPAVDGTPAGLRSILATAAFRILQSDAPTREARN